VNIPQVIRDRNEQRIAGIVHPFQVLVRELLGFMEHMGYPMLVTAGVRTQAEQVALYAKGRTQPGAIVTYADGIIKRSNHQAKADGKGYAVDCAFLVDGTDRDGEIDTPTWDADRPWPLYGTLAETLGQGKVTWGGRWTSLRDLPHIEWRG
jgi:peptidoglycan L-alanyl-D-glutamate endopeptidase CwlK